MQPSEQERVLIVDDEPAVLQLLAAQLAYLGHDCVTAPSAEKALDTLGDGGRIWLVLSDLQMPGMSGRELLARVLEIDPNIQVVMISGHQDMETVRHCLREGACDFLIKPYELSDLSTAVGRARDRLSLLRQNERYRRDLERMVMERTTALRQTRDIAILTLAKLAESRDSETGLHLERMAAYAGRLAEELERGPYGQMVHHQFVELVRKSSPLHDIGKVGIPDAILRKPGALDPGELAVMRTHATIGGDTLRSVIEQFEGHTFLLMGMEIAYSHHERWDGAGYPAGLAGDAIPLAARIVALADAYDAITTERPYKAACGHAEAVERIVVDRGKHFDPVLVEAFERAAADFAGIRRRLRPAAALEPARKAG